MTAPAIEVADASRIYEGTRGHVVALNDVSLTVPTGRFVSIIGPSGCGKSTLLRLIAGLEVPDSGTVTIGGRRPSEAAATKSLGFVPQSPALLPWRSVLANVTLPGKVNRRGNQGRVKPDPMALLDKVGLRAAAHRMPHELSGGMQQRAAIARAFALAPEVLVMDEPFAALDEFTREVLQQHLLDLWNEIGATVVFVTHNITEAVRLSDTVVVMAGNPGRITDTIDIDLVRPRSADVIETPEFHDYELRLRALLHRSLSGDSA